MRSSLGVMIVLEGEVLPRRGSQHRAGSVGSCPATRDAARRDLGPPALLLSHFTPPYYQVLRETYNERKE